MPPILDQIIKRARADCRCIVLPEGDDIRVIEAAIQIKNKGLAEPVLIGDADAIHTLANNNGFDSGAIKIVEPHTDNHFDSYATQLYELRKHKGWSKQQAAERALQPLLYGALMVHMGDADGYVAGAANTTTDVLRAALQIIGMAEDAKLVSSFFIMEHDLPHQTIQGTCVYADCAMVIDPNAEQLAQIAISTASSAQNLLRLKPKVALLSFSTAGSGNHPHVEKVRCAGKIIAERYPELDVMPEVQFDAAIIPQVRQQKAPEMKVEAPANVFIFPELQSANIGYKIAQRIGGVRATGPVLQGLKKPVNDLSRGCSVDDIVRLVAVTAVQAGGR